MPPTSIIESLSRICYDAGRLISVEHALFRGDPRFVTAVRLTFESHVAVFRAIGDDDTISVAEGGPFLEEDDVGATVTDIPPWRSCIGRKVHWAWLQINQQGYEDAIRLEFEVGTSGVELVVVGSAIQLFSYTAVR